MRSYAFGALAASLVLFASPARAIVGGDKDGSRHPNVGTVVVYHPQYGITPYASGTLVHPRVLLTAGHVIASIEAGEFTLIGVSFTSEVTPDGAADPKTWFDARVAHHVGAYKRIPGAAGAGEGQHDIGVLILDKPVRGIGPATLPCAGLLDELRQAGQLNAGPDATQLTVVGYGWDLSFPPPKLAWPWQPVEIDYEGWPALFWGWQRRTAQCGFLGLLNDSWLVLSQSPTYGTLRGDSGGPVFWTDPGTGQEILVSIISWGTQMVGSGFYYRVDTSEALGFIEDALRSL